MARKRSKGGARPSPRPASQVIYQARLGLNGAVVRVQPPITEAQAVAVRQGGGDVVVCGTDKAANSVTACRIEQAASGRWRRCRPHVNAGPNALPHYQPDPRGTTTGHTFYESDTKHAL